MTDPVEAADHVDRVNRAWADLTDAEQHAVVAAQMIEAVTGPDNKTGPVPPPVADEDIPDPDDAPADWAVTGISRAAATVARCRRVRAELDEVRAVAAAEVEKWQSWAATEEDRLQARLDWYESHLEGFARERRDRDPDHGKTTNLPGARIATKDTAGKWVVDDTAALPWAAAHRPDLIAWKPRFDLAAARRAFKPVDGQIVDRETGEVVAGVTPEPDRVTVTITYLED